MFWMMAIWVRRRSVAKLLETWRIHLYAERWREIPRLQACSDDLAGWFQRGGAFLIAEIRVGGCLAVTIILLLGILKVIFLILSKGCGGNDNNNQMSGL